MKFTYKPEGEEPREWLFSASDMTVGEVLLLESRLDMTMGEIAEAERRGSGTVTLTMWWMARRRAEPDLKFSDLRDAKIGALSVSYDDEGESEDEAPKEEPAAEKSDATDD